MYIFNLPRISTLSLKGLSVLSPPEEPVNIVHHEVKSPTHFKIKGHCIKLFY